MITMANKLSVPVFWLFLFLSQTAAAHNGTGIDAQENVFGATNINAVTGHGRLTAGISRDGDLTVLSWPNPSYTDQLGYITSNALNARDLPRFGAPEGAGSFLGLSCTKTDSESLVTWLRDRTVWDISQDYGPTDGPNPHTMYTSVSLGLQVLVVDSISPISDTMVRDVEVQIFPGSAVVSCSLLSYVNLSPLPPNARVPELPLVDWLFDGRNDFAAIWDEDNRAVLHFHPDDQRVHTTLMDLLTGPSVDFGIIGDMLKQEKITGEEIDLLLEGLPNLYSDGSWAMISTEPPPSQYQVGFDHTPFCELIKELSENIQLLPDKFENFTLPVSNWVLKLFECWRTGPELVASKGWLYPAADPWNDVQDGELSGHGLAAGEVAAALKTDLNITEGVGKASLIIGFGSNMISAREALQAGRWGDVAQRAEEALDIWLSQLRIPGQPGSRPWQVARRALIDLRVGTCAYSGAVVASIARQPPYALDWPRDGAFFNIVFDASGQSNLAAKRADLYASWQRAEAVEPTMFVNPDPPEDPDTGKSDTYPADAWEMNYYADGMVGGTFRFEIDTTAFAVWAQVAHAGWADDPEAYLLSLWPSIRRGADLLARWRDADTGLHAPAQEDDAPEPAQTLHGAVTVFGALDMAARAARLLGRHEHASLWEDRARELRDAMETHFYDDNFKALVMGESGRLPIMASGLSDTGPGSWSVWPMTMYDRDDPRVEDQIAHDWGVIESVVNMEPPGGLYFMKTTVSMAVAALNLFSSQVQSLPDKLSLQATPYTSHFGEVMVVVGDGEDRYAQQRVSTPHLWEGALYFLTVLAVEDPAALQKYEDVLPESPFHARPFYPDGGVLDGGVDTGMPDASMTPDAGQVGTKGKKSGCGCGISVVPSIPSRLALLFFALILVWLLGFRNRKV